MADELTQAAKDAIADAVRIVKEDKWDAFLRDRVGKHAGQPTPTPTEPPAPTVDAPQPKTDTPPNPNTPPESGRKSAYWGVFEGE